MTDISKEAVYWQKVELMGAMLIASKTNEAVSEIIDDAGVFITAQAVRIEELEAALSESDALGKWMSAALDDEDVCDEMKSDIRAWFSALGPAIIEKPAP